MSPGACMDALRNIGGPVAQLAEQQTLNLRVGGSIPPRLTSIPSKFWYFPPRLIRPDTLRVAESARRRLLDHQKARPVPS